MEQYSNFTVENVCVPVGHNEQLLAGHIEQCTEKCVNSWPEFVITFPAKNH